MMASRSHTQQLTIRYDNNTIIAHITYTYHTPALTASSITYLADPPQLGRAAAVAAAPGTRREIIIVFLSIIKRFARTLARAIKHAASIRCNEANS